MKTRLSILFCSAALAALAAAACQDGGPTAEPPALPPAVEPVAPLAAVDEFVLELTPQDALPIEVTRPTPQTAPEWVDLARERLDAGDPLATIEACDRALALEPAEAETLHLKGRALWALDRGHEAVVTLEAARRSDPQNGQIANALGYLWLLRGKPAEAIPHLEAARDALPGVAYVRNNLGVAYERAGRVADAVVEYEAAVAAGDSGNKATASLARLAHEADTAGPEATAAPQTDEWIAEAGSGD